MRFMAAVLGALSLSAAAGPGWAQELVRSDLPLWTGMEDENFFPKNFIDEDSFGCSSNIAFGDYRLIPEPNSEEGSGRVDLDSWYRITNYGVMHCALVLREADTVEALQGAPFEFFWVIKLWEQSFGSQRIEVLAIQQGPRGGSSYLLLHRPVGQIDAPMTLLAPRCPREMVRDVGTIDVWMTRYCAVPDRQGLRRIARDALRYPPIGTLVREPPLEISEGRKAEN